MEHVKDDNLDHCYVKLGRIKFLSVEEIAQSKVGESKTNVCYLRTKAEKGRKIRDFKKVCKKRKTIEEGKKEF